MKGKCLCGDIEYEISGFNGNIYQCHCSLCRRQGGSSSNSGTVVPTTNLVWLKGQDKVKTWKKDTGFTSSFCQNCGSLVPNVLRGLDYYWVPVGALEDGAYRVVANLYLGAKATWAAVSPEGARFDTMPDVEAFIDLLHHKVHE
ncbi:MAG: GFA family protein [Hahellaceae bacterium]|nr:GFA family protein [Hahellaceae bacterium]MCP5170125.1 GFA family protein [Hahellaceae bacterium]